MQRGRAGREEEGRPAQEEDKAAGEGRLAPVGTPERDRVSVKLALKSEI